ncbi:MAG TPA: pilus assembly protein TadG-related protein [Vicinamibacterales bacterium]|nr:pilus assembly protein TadG-related protein [Vicinamibacterales bacterium]
MTRLRRLRDDESGMSYVFIGMGMMAFLSASMLAIDVGMLMTSRNQAQNAADAGALAGATALVFNDYDDRTPSGPAVTHAIAAAKANAVMGEDVSVEVMDVEFPVDEAGEANRVKVTVHRTSERGNPVSTLIAKFFGMETADIGATATAEASPANAMTCVKPFTIPDKWIEKQTPGWDGLDTYDAYNSKGVPLANPDIYIPADQPGYTGYNQESNRGQLLEIRAATGNNITVSFYFSLSIGGVEGGMVGGEAYEWNIAHCNTSIMHWGDPLIQEPGAMAGPTIQGAEQLISRDPGAYWDHGTGTVKGSAFSTSPRVFPIPLYDPPFYDSGKRNGRYADLKVANWIGFFLESTQGNGIYGRIIPISGIRDKNGPHPKGVFPMAIRLVQ